jgi:elongation factor Ts
MDIKADMVKNLRDKTGAGFMDCKAALQESSGDYDKAIEILRIKGVAKAARKAERLAKDGLIYSYIHPGSKIGVLVEVNCETDFVARTDDFKNFVKDIAMHIAAANPRYLNVEAVPAEVLGNEKRIFEEQAKESGKPAKAIEKMIEGRIKKFYQESCLMEQPFIKDEAKSVSDLLKDSIAKIGENISIRRFARYQVGEGIE